MYNYLFLIIYGRRTFLAPAPPSVGVHGHGNRHRRWDQQPREPVSYSPEGLFYSFHIPFQSNYVAPFVK